MARRPSLRSGPGSDVQLTLAVEPRTPLEVGWSRDERPLGIHVRSLRLGGTRLAVRRDAIGRLTPQPSRGSDALEGLVRNTPMTDVLRGRGECSIVNRSCSSMLAVHGGDRRCVACVRPLPGGTWLRPRHRRVCGGASTRAVPARTAITHGSSVCRNRTPSSSAGGADADALGGGRQLMGACHRRSPGARTTERRETQKIRRHPRHASAAHPCCLASTRSFHSERLATVDFLKVDVDGRDLKDVLESARNVLGRTYPCPRCRHGSQLVRLPQTRPSTRSTTRTSCLRQQGYSLFGVTVRARIARSTFPRRSSFVMSRPDCVSGQPTKAINLRPRLWPRRHHCEPGGRSHRGQAREAGLHPTSSSDSRIVPPKSSTASTRGWMSSVRQNRCSMPSRRFFGAGE